MSNEELHAIATAYQRLVIVGFGPSHLKRAGSFETLLLTQQRELETNSQLTGRLSSCKNLLARSLVRLTRSVEYGFLKPYLTHWQQEIIQAESATDLGKFCLHLTDILFPDKANQENADD